LPAPGSSPGAGEPGGVPGSVRPRPLVVIYPDDVWYSHVSLEEAQVIFSEHILAGRPVDALRFRVGEPGAHKLARDQNGRPTQRCTLCRDGRAVTAAYEGE